jgi:Derlin-2/3
VITRNGAYLPALQVAIAYRWSRLHPNASVHVYVINVPALWYPWAFLALDFMVSGPTQAVVDFTGILGAHLHLFLTEEWPRQGGTKIGTPNWFRNLFPGSVTAGRGEARPYGTVIPPREEAGTSSGVPPGASGGNFRGQGYRLG